MSLGEHRAWLILTFSSIVWFCCLGGIVQAERRLSNHLYLPLVTSEAALVPAATSWGAPIVTDPRRGLVWVVNPDAGSISAVDTVQLRLADSVSIGGEPWALALTPDRNTLLVVDRAGGDLVLLDPNNLRIRNRVFIGPEPAQVVVSPDGKRAYVTVTAANTLAIVDLQRGDVLRYSELPFLPYALAIDAERAQVYVTHFQAQAIRAGGMGHDDGAEGLISVLNLEGNLIGSITLPPDQHGFANQLASIAIFGDRAWVPTIRAAPELPNALSTTVFAAVSSIDLASGQEDSAARLDLNDELVFGSPVNNPLAAVPSPDGNFLYVVLAGSDLIEVVDIRLPTQPRLVGFLPAGRNPQGIAIAADGRYGYVMSYLSRAVTVLDLAQMKVTSTIQVAPETLDPLVLRGKILFNTVADPRMAKSSWVSCASCHAHGGSDGVTWMLADGPRQSPALWNAGETLPWHWSAALDEAQDVEDSIHTLQFGLGLATGADPDLLGTPNAGRSSDLDALAAFLSEGIRAPQLPQASADLAVGRRLFIEQGCVQCHAGPHWTISRLPGAPGTLDPDGNGMIDSLLRDVGTASAADVRGDSGFDVPSLLGVRLTAPYMHDGSLPSLEAVIDSGHPIPGSAATRSLSGDERQALLAFLLSIDPTTQPVPYP